MKTRFLILSLCFAITMFSCTQRHKQASGKVFPSHENAIRKAERLEEFSLPDTNRNFITLSDEVAKHRFTIIDFWASWCAPCRQEMPTMVRLRKMYDEETLGIIGISLDTDYNKWMQATKDMYMRWPQFSELKGWDSYIVKRLNINSIPYTIIVDKKMNIIAKGMRGEELELFLQEIIN